MNWLEENNLYMYRFDEYSVLYSPIARKYVVATHAQMDDYFRTGKYAETIDILTHYTPLSQQRKVREPSDYTLLTVLPNNICNFSCSYCYSAAGRNNAEISIEQLRVAIDYFLCSKPTNHPRPLTIAYMGGGEPFISWQTVREGIEYAIAMAKEKQIKLSHRIITNGSIVSNEITTFLLKNSIEVSVSFEILPEIQNLQRKNYELVHGNIRKLIDQGIQVQINSTITPANVYLMEEMIDCIKREFPEVKNAMFEPVTAAELFDTPEQMDDFFTQYAKSFIHSRRLGDRYGIDLTSFAYLRTIYPLERACAGELCLTADGNITACYCIASPKEELFQKACYGTVDHEVQFDLPKYYSIIGHNLYSKPECNDCQVKWNCGGGCYHQNNLYSAPFRQVICNFTKSFVEKLIHYKVAKQVDSATIETPILIQES